MVKVFEGHPQNLYWQSLWQLAAVLGVEPETMFRQLRLSILAGRAKFTVHGGFDDHPGSALIRRLGNFEMDVAIRPIDAGFL